MSDGASASASATCPMCAGRGALTGIVSDYCVSMCPRCDGVGGVSTETLTPMEMELLGVVLRPSAPQAGVDTAGRQVYDSG